MRSGALSWPPTAVNPPSSPLSAFAALRSGRHALVLTNGAEGAAADVAASVRHERAGRTPLVFRTFFRRSGGDSLAFEGVPSALSALRGGRHAVVLLANGAERAAADVVASVRHEWDGRTLLVCRAFFTSDADSDAAQQPLSALDAFHALHGMGHRGLLSVVAAGLRAADAATRDATRRFVETVVIAQMDVTRGVPDAEGFAAFVQCAAHWRSDRLRAVLQLTLGDAAHAALTAPDPTLEALRHAARDDEDATPLFVLMVRGPRPEALRSTDLVPRDVRLLWAAAEPPSVRSALFRDDDKWFKPGEEEWAHQRLVDASVRLLGYAPLASSTPPLGGPRDDSTTTPAASHE